MNYFELFEIPLQFEVDAIKIRPKFLELSRKYHPDFHSHENEINQEKLIEICAAVNKGWQVFQEPLATLYYALQLSGKITEQDNPTLSADFLMEMMELNEQLVEKNSNQCAILQEKLHQYKKELYEGVKSLLVKSPAATAEIEFERIKEYYYKSKYLDRIQKRIESAEDNMFSVQY